MRWKTKKQSGYKPDCFFLQKKSQEQTLGILCLNILVTNRKHFLPHQLYQVFPR